jgi:hypothetical protein
MILHTFRVLPKWMATDDLTYFFNPRATNRPTLRIDVFIALHLIDANVLYEVASTDRRNTLRKLLYWGLPPQSPKDRSMYASPTSQFDLPVLQQWILRISPSNADLIF